MIMSDIISVRCEECEKVMVNFESGWELSVPNVRSDVYGHEVGVKCKNRVRIFYKVESR